MSLKCTIGLTAAVLVAIITGTGCSKKPDALAKIGAGQSPPVLKPLTVAAVNLFDKLQIQAVHIKTITVSEEEYNTRVKEALAEVPNRKLEEVLTSTQLVGRITRTPIQAGKLIFEDQLEQLMESPPVSQ